MLERTQTYLRILMANYFLDVSPLVQGRLIGTLAELRAGIGRSEVERVAALMVMDANLAEGQGYTDYATCLLNAENELRIILRILIDPVESTHREACTVGEIYLDFVNGEVAGSIDGCNAAEVADALVAIANELWRMAKTPSYLGYDGGTFCEGNPLSNEGDQ
jgi:hypothetical protein